MNHLTLCGLALLLALLVSPCAGESLHPAKSKTVLPKKDGPIITYWAGPGYAELPMTEAAAKQMAEGGWNLVWCHENELDIVHRSGLRAQLTDPLLNPASLHNPQQRAALDALIERVKRHPALSSYFMTDEPSAIHFPELGRFFAYLRQKDPHHLLYLNLFPTYATNEQLGTKGDPIPAYQEYLRQYIEVVKPTLLSYDHYQFAVGRDTPDYFLNLALMRQAALNANLPFLNIVQACSWTASIREPVEEEMRYLVYTTLAYGARGISYYVYQYPGHKPGIAKADGTPTEVYAWLKPLNHAFADIATQLTRFQSTGVYFIGMMPPGAEPLPTDTPFQLERGAFPPEQAFKPGERVQGVLIGLFRPTKRPQSPATHALVVNLDYKATHALTLTSPAPLEVFDPTTRRWSRGKEAKITLSLLGGEGKLLRLRR